MTDIYRLRRIVIDLRIFISLNFVQLREYVGFHSRR